MLGDMRVRRNLPRLVAFALGPVLIPQGRITLARVPRLDEAGGPTSGTAERVVRDGDRLSDEGAERRQDEVSLLVTGESTAVGVGVDQHSDGIAPALAEHLHDALEAPVTWTVIGRNGGRLRANPRRMLPPLAGRHDVVVVLLGVNDTLGLTSPARWRREMTTLLDDARSRLQPGGLVVLAGVPQLHDFPALPQPLRAVMGAHGRALDGVLADIATGHDDVVHVTTPAMQHDEDLAADGFHPSAHGYRRWAERLHEQALAGWAATRKAP